METHFRTFEKDWILSSNQKVGPKTHNSKSGIVPA